MGLHLHAGGLKGKHTEGKYNPVFTLHRYGSAILQTSIRFANFMTCARALGGGCRRSIGSCTFCSQDTMFNLKTHNTKWNGARSGKCHVFTYRLQKIMIMERRWRELALELSCERSKVMLRSTSFYFTKECWFMSVRIAVMLKHVKLVGQVLTYDYECVFPLYITSLMYLLFNTFIYFADSDC